MASASAVARAGTEDHTVDYTITVLEDQEVETEKMNAGNTVQFSSPDGWFKIEFPTLWPFTKPHSSIVSHKVGQHWESRVLTLVEGKKAHFNCFRKHPKSGKLMLQEYGGEINPRGK